MHFWSKIARPAAKRSAIAVTSHLQNLRRCISAILHPKAQHPSQCHNEEKWTPWTTGTDTSDNWSQA